MSRRNVFLLIISILVVLLIGVTLVTFLNTKKSDFVASGHPQWAPIMYQKNDSIVGAGPELVRKISEDLGFSISSKHEGSWDVVQDKMRTGDIDVIVAAYKTVERETYMDYSIPYTVDPVSLFVAKGQEFVSENWDELIEKKGVVTVGDSYGEKFDNFIKEKLNVREVVTPDEAFELLKNREADYFVYALYSGENYITTNNMTDEIVALPTQVSAENFYITISKKSVLNSYLPQINLLIKKYTMDGTIEKLIAKHRSPEQNTKTTAVEVSRDQIEEKYKWDLTDMFASNEEWYTKKDEIKSKLAEFDVFEGKLGQSADTLYDCLELISQTKEAYSMLAGYANRLSDEDVRKQDPVSMRQEIEQFGINLSAKLSFVDPEIIAIDSNKMAGFFEQKLELKEYAHFIDNIQRLKPHIRSSEVEEVVSQAGLMASSPYDVFSVFKDAEMPRATITLPGGESVRLDDSAFTLHRANSDQATRKQVFENFFGEYKKYEQTFGTQLYGNVKVDLFYKNVSNYDSSLENSLNANNIPVEVYTNLITSVHENLPTLHRYLNLRKKMMGLDELHYYDLYPSLVKDFNKTYSVEEAQEMIKKALIPLGDDYVATVDKAFKDRWIDMYPSTGKTSGAYSSASYGVHPYILMNYNGQYNDVSTLAHELGHTMHSYYSNKNQNYLNARYPTFLAEVASITNESLLDAEILKNTTDSQERLSLLGNKLEVYRTTLFRQAQFAEFELKIHELAERGESLTGGELTKVYLDILKTYYGADEGVTKIDDLYGIEWAYIPHFYYNFYVYQYSTSMCAALSVSEKITANDGDMRAKYVSEFLSAGNSEYAIPILKRIGIDMTTTEPCELAFRKMDKIMDEMESLIENN